MAERLQTLLAERFNAIDSWDETGISEFSEFAAPLVEGAQAVTARFSEVYVAQILSDVLGQHVPPKGFQFPGSLRGIPTVEVYRRPFVDIWTGLKNGMLFEDAKNAGLTRLSEIADDDLSLAYRWGAQKSMEAQKIQKYRRVVRPELTKSGSCDLCILAAENVYNRSKLLPIHTHCRCAVMPIIGSLDPGQSLNAQDLGSLQEPKELPVIRDHGELGPLLQVSGQQFTSQAQVA